MVIYEETEYASEIAESIRKVQHTESTSENRDFESIAYVKVSAAAPSFPISTLGLDYESVAIIGGELLCANAANILRSKSFSGKCLLSDSALPFYKRLQLPADTAIVAPSYPDHLANSPNEVYAKLGEDSLSLFKLLKQRAGFALSVREQALSIWKSSEDYSDILREFNFNSEGQSQTTTWRWFNTSFGPKVAK